MSAPVKQVYTQTKDRLEEKFGQREARNLARLIFIDGFGIPHPDRSAQIFPDDLREKLDRIVARTLDDEPIQYVLGRTEFYDVPLLLRPGVLIPRQETEELVHWILEAEASRDRAAVLDVGTGSGCIALALKTKRPRWRVEGCDVSPEALNIARENMQANALKLVLANINILNRHEWKQYGNFDVIVSNPPYIPPSERHLMSESTLRHEPEIALFVEGTDTLLHYKAVADFAKKYLNPGGALYFECNEFNALDLQIWLGSDDWRTELRQDLNGKDRMLRCYR